MKVAVTMFKNGVSPRVDITDSLLIYNIEKGSVIGQEKYPLSFEQPSELVSFLLEKDIEKIICGGCPQFYLRSLNLYRFDVVHGVSGEPGRIIAQLLDGKLDNSPLNRPCKRHRGGRGLSQHGTDCRDDYAEMPRKQRRNRHEKKI
jgi:predicted Fe-Mo cluster-binding NifX family protein